MPAQFPFRGYACIGIAFSVRWVFFGALELAVFMDGMRGTYSTQRYPADQASSDDERQDMTDIFVDVGEEGLECVSEPTDRRL
jgi:hypothetical protein